MYYYGTGDRQFIFPFLVGAVTGGAAVGLTRPRPVYVNNPGFGMYPNPGMPFFYNSYGGFIPYR